MKHKRIAQKKSVKLSLCPDTSSEKDGREPIPSEQVSGLFVSKERGSWCGGEDDDSATEYDKEQEDRDPQEGTNE